MGDLSKLSKLIGIVIDSGKSFKLLDSTFVSQPGLRASFSNYLCTLNFIIQADNLRQLALTTFRWAIE
jgi:hypothetical protein